MRYLRCIFLILLVACSSDKKAGSNDEPGDSDSICPAGQILDGAGVCRDVCAADADCETHETCFITAGMCMPRETTECDPAVDNCDPCDPETEICDPVECDPGLCRTGWVCPDPDDDDGSGLCIPGPGYCVDNDDCNLTERCDNGRCISRVGDVVQTCTTDAECGLLMTCQFGVCTGCLDDLQCMSSEHTTAKCVAGTCVVSDNPAINCIDADCAEGSRCDPTTGVCVAICSSDDDCSEGEICAPVLEQCIVDPGCEVDDDCEGELTCSPMKVCTGCSDDVPCPTGLTCILESCLPDIGGSPCDDAECAEDELCDPADGSCYPSDGSCATNEDCRTGHSCNEFLHVCTGCSADGDCRPGQRCLLGGCVQF